MTSELTKEEFERHLSKVTNAGPPWVMSSPFAIFSIFSNKLFYGEVDKNNFQLTRNSIMPLSNTYYVINGQYRNDDDKRLSVDYEIQPLRFYYFLERTAIILSIILINIAFYISEEATIQAFIIANTFLVVLGLIRIILSKSNKRRLEERFQQEFKLRP